MGTKAKILKNKSGYSLVEMVIYVTLLSIITLVIINTVISFTKSYHDLGALRAIEHSANDSMERMTRDIRGASSVDSGNSTLGTSPGALTIISTANSISTTTKFYLQSGILKVDVNGVYSGPLTLTNATVTNLTFASLNSGKSTAVKLDMTVQATVGGVTKIKSYHSTIILRGQ